MNNVQLIIYPQFFNGQFNEISLDTNEFVVNGLNFNGLGSATSYDTVGAVATAREDALVNNPPAVPNTWFRYRSTTGGSPALPTVTSGAVVFNSIAATNFTGIYQELTSLTIGQSYTVNLDVSLVGTGLVYINTYNVSGSSVFLNSQYFTSAAASTISTSFTASNTNHILMISYSNNLATNIRINKISTLPQGTEPSGAKNVLASGEVICDLYEDENIPLTLSVDNFKNVAEKIQSYSKAFKLPGTKKNNKLFDNIFEITRSAEGIVFNPYIKTQATLKQDGFLLFEGYLRLIDIQDKKGEISYNVNLYSEVIALADFLKERKFKDLDFSELNHRYNYTQIKNSWLDILGLDNALPTGTYAGTAGATTTGVLKYPFVDWEHSYYLDSSTGLPVLPNLESAFRPFIKIKYCIDRIFEPTPFTYTSNFFSTIEFSRLYMDFNWGADANPNANDQFGFLTFDPREDTASYATTSFSAYPLSSTGFPWLPPLPTEFGYSSNVFTVPVNQENTTYNIDYMVKVICKKDATLDMRWKVVTAAGATYYIDAVTVALEGSAVAHALFTEETLTNAGDTIFDVIVTEGGAYTSLPTAVINPTTNPTTTSTLDVTLTGSAVTDIEVLNPDDGWDGEGENVVQFNGVNPRYTYAGSFGETLQPGDTLQLEWKASIADAIRQDDTKPYDPYTGLVTTREYTTTIKINLSILGMTDSVILNTLRGELGQWEFLKGIMTMFNLVSLPDPNNPDNILIEPYADVFINDTAGSTLAARSIAHDWTDKIDIEEIKLMPLTDLNKKTIFKFVEDDEDYAFNLYKESVQQHLYGSKVYDASGFTVLEGIDEIVAAPFAATVPKPIDMQFTDFIVPTVYSYDADSRESEGFDNSPRIMVNNGVKTLSSCTYTVPFQNGVAGATTEDEFLQFSHLSSIPTIAGATDYHFGECQLIVPIGNPVNNNLFNSYWLPYYSQLYNPDTRIMTLKVDLRASDINEFNFQDTVFIKNREFRVNKIDYKPNDLSIVEFILIP
jgi:hypothetical protein